MANYTIRDLEKLSGVKAHTIRIWEKRYGIVEPKRTDTNIRYYTDEDLKKILNISILNNNGLKISKIASLNSDEIKDKVLEINFESPDLDVKTDSLIVAMIDLDDSKFEKILSQSIIRLGFDKTVSKVLFPFFEKIGMLWQIGTINPAQEHFITNLVKHKLIVAIESIPETEYKYAKKFLLFLPEGEYHEISLLYYYYLTKRMGHKVMYLGQSVPMGDLKQVDAIYNADFVFTAVLSSYSHDVITDYLSRIAEAFVDKKIFITGAQIRDFKDQIPSAMIPVANLEDFKEKLDQLV